MKGVARVATAPGKIMLAGEYAVLEGADAVLAAVNRRATARVAGIELRQSSFLCAVRDQIAAHAGARSPAARAADCIVADSRAFADSHGTKLGLGSSAAVTVAATACALDVDARDPEPALIHRLAHAAHGNAQRKRGARGSGADVAAAVYGGVIVVRCQDDLDQLPMVRPVAAHIQAPLVYVWTGQAADTPALVARVQALRQRDRAAYERAIAQVADAAGMVIAALRPGARPAELVQAVEAGARAVARLGRDAGVALETDLHRRVAALARNVGGTAKPTGAGAGDLVVAAFPDAGAAEAFCAAARPRDDTRRGRELTDRGLADLALVDLAITARGVSLSEPAGDFANTTH